MSSETLQMIAYLSQSFSQDKERKFTGLTRFSGDDKTVKDLMITVFKNLGDQNACAENLSLEEVRRVQNSRLKTVTQLFNIYGPKPRLMLLDTILLELKGKGNDRAISILT